MTNPAAEALASLPRFQEVAQRIGRDPAEYATETMERLAPQPSQPRLIEPRFDALTRTMAQERRTRQAAQTRIAQENERLRRDLAETQRTIERLERRVRAIPDELG